MSVESVTYISDLDYTQPLTTDQRKQGDDHLRNIKLALRQTFPNITSAVTATASQINSLAAQVTSVFDYMTSAQIADVQAGTALVDVTTPITTAIAASGSSRLYFPKGTYKVTDDFSLPANCHIFGDGPQATRILSSNLSSPVFTVANLYCSVRSLTIDYTSTPTSGATAIDVSSSYFYYEDIVIDAAYVGIKITSGQGCVGSNIKIFDYVSIGYYVLGGTNDHDLGDFFFAAGSATNGALGGIRLENGAQAIRCTNGEITGGVYALTTTASSYVIGSRPAYNRFTNVFFDSATSACEIDNIVETTFTDCWFSNGRSGGGAPGATIGTTNSDSLRFKGCEFFNCGTHGALVRANAKRTMFTQCAFDSNSYTAGAGVAHGLVFAANTTDFVVTNCIARNGLYTGTQGYGIIVNGGTSDRYVIQNNLVSSNVTAGVSDGGSGANKNVANNY